MDRLQSSYEDRRLRGRSVMLSISSHPGTISPGRESLMLKEKLARAELVMYYMSLLFSRRFWNKKGLSSTGKGRSTWFGIFGNRTQCSFWMMCWMIRVTDGWERAPRDAPASYSLMEGGAYPFKLLFTGNHVRKPVNKGLQQLNTHGNCVISSLFFR